ncbi:hypothetical protein [Fluviicola taffensis]|uniref:PHP domain protein n=1 Tax=Fluviicola taffensis (strain DSM 16823 / NCIMB 13979 / RW262) TaxID=755732 RepID=F2IAI7_FLUTR|nr:hypothetical protein [Fluviicola taffensis]AEA43123.1 hypothetical protein Fluta_1127 [Fluviicola taffensis DSM 16823]
MKILSRLSKFLLKFVASIALLLFVVIGIQYLSTTIYDFKEPVAFTGKKWSNPYQSIDSGRVKANFHAHSAAWKSITYGKFSPEKTRQSYLEKEYDVASISNYFSIDTTGKKDPLYIPVYEHGLNIFKTHCLSINASKVSYTDYFLLQSTSHQQKVIESIKAQNGIVAIAHPKLAMGRSINDMKYLMHYDLVEVLNHFRISDEYWDAALSAGRLSYLVADDDSHSTDADEFARVWTVILSNGKTKEPVLNDLVNGKAFGVYTEYNTCENDFVSCELNSDSLFVEFAIPADTILFIGQNGVVKHKAFKSAKAFYRLKDSDTYIRVVAKNYESSIYLNPIVRYEKKVPLNSLNVPKEQMLQTWLFRAFVTVVIYFLLRLIYRMWKPKRKKLA